MPADWPIIVGGSHRSGTTLFRRLLNGHPHIFCPPEIKFHTDLLGQFPNDPLAHGRLGASIRALGLPTETWLDAFGQAFCRCYDQAAQAAGKRRWADKNPENGINAAHWDRLLGGRMAFILVVRHPLDVIASMQEIRMDKVIPLHVEGRAEHVRRYVEPGLAFVDANPDRSHVVRYEDLVVDPEDALARLAQFLSESSAGMIENLRGHHGDGLGDPKAAAHSGISRAQVGRWRRDLTEADARLATPIVAPLCQRLGYTLPEAAAT